MYEMIKKILISFLTCFCSVLLRAENLDIITDLHGDEQTIENENLPQDSFDSVKNFWIVAGGVIFGGSALVAAYESDHIKQFLMRNNEEKNKFYEWVGVKKWKNRAKTMEGKYIPQEFDANQLGLIQIDDLCDEKSIKDINTKEIAKVFKSPMKRVIFEEGIKLADENISMKIETLSSVDPSNHLLDSFQIVSKAGKIDPRYLSDLFKLQDYPIDYQRGFYQYDDENAVYVIFSNRRSGGGEFGGGNVQEEVAAQEFPQKVLLDALYHDGTYHSAIHTRYHPAKATADWSVAKSGNGNPNPLIYRNMMRVFRSEDDYYGSDAFKKFGKHYEEKKNFSGFLSEIADPKPIVDLLHIAAPDISGEINVDTYVLKAKYYEKKSKEIITLLKKNKVEIHDKQFSYINLLDIFNTSVAAMTLVQKIYEDDGISYITGLLGAGAFAQDHVAAVVIQRLAAHYVGIRNLGVYDISSALEVHIENVWDEIEAELGKKEMPIKEVILLASKIMRRNADEYIDRL